MVSSKDEELRWLGLWALQTVFCIIGGPIQALLLLSVIGSGEPRRVLGWLPVAFVVMIHNLVPFLAAASTAVLLSRYFRSWASPGTWTWVLPLGLFVYRWQSFPMGDLNPRLIWDLFALHDLKGESIVAFAMGLPIICAVGYSLGMALARLWDFFHRGEPAGL